VKILLECEVDEKTPYTLTEELYSSKSEPSRKERGARMVTLTSSVEKVGVRCVSIERR
jgi:hypothetical protein